MLPEAGQRYNRTEGDRLMRYPTFAVAMFLLSASYPSSLHAASAPKPPCKKIRDAVWAGRTLEQIMKEFDTDALTVMKCTQKQGRRKADPKTSKKGTKTGSKSGAGAGASSMGKPNVTQPAVRKPPAPRSGPWPRVP
jgi:hypothetical protein